MKGTMTIIKADGTVIAEEIIMTPALLSIRAGLDGSWIEVVPRWTEWQGQRCVVFCDEEGKVKGLPNNVLATKEWYAQVPEAIGRDHLVGPIVIVSGDDELLANL